MPSNITDLTGYTWVGNSSLILNNTFNYGLNFDYEFNDEIVNAVNLQCYDFKGMLFLSYTGQDVYDGAYWYNQAYRTIQITGGTDATNSTLIAWLEANGALTAPAPAEFALRINGVLTDKYNNQTINALHYNDITYKIATVYSITTNITNGSYTGATAIADGFTATGTITAGNGYTLPSSITVTGATLDSYNSTTGVFVISGTTGNVTVTAVCEHATPTYPVKGDLITMTLGNATPAAGTNNTYRVLSVNGSIAEVVAMFDQSTSQVFSNNDTTYAGSDLDTYLNTTWYGTLNATAQAAIVAKSVQQYQYIYSSSAYNATTHASYADYSTKAVVGSAVSRNVYALDVEDIETYFGGTFSTANIWTLFWNTSSAPGTPTYPWLRSADADDPDRVFYVNGNLGSVRIILVGNSDVAARPAFTIDLSKISWA